MQCRVWGWVGYDRQNRRQDVRQNSVNKAESMADSVIQGQSSVEGRAEVKAKAVKLCLCISIFPLF